MNTVSKLLNGKCGIYQIINLVNGKRYIGSSKDLYYRLSKHIWDLNRNSHVNNHLQNSWSKYGKDSFEVTILDTITETTKEQLDRHLMVLEKTYIEYYDSFNNGYNETLG